MRAVARNVARRTGNGESLHHVGLNARTTLNSRANAGRFCKGIRTNISHEVVARTMMWIFPLPVVFWPAPVDITRDNHGTGIRWHC